MDEKSTIHDYCGHACGYVAVSYLDSRVPVSRGVAVFILAVWSDGCRGSGIKAAAQLGVESDTLERWS